MEVPLDSKEILPEKIDDLWFLSDIIDHLFFYKIIFCGDNDK